MSIRMPAVAGRFYPGTEGALRATVDDLLVHATVDNGVPKAIVAPHAGYVYSGPIAASAYAPVARLRDVVTRVVLLGPAHRVALHGMAVPSVDAFRTPLGDVPIAAGARDAIVGLPGVIVDDRPHAEEHSLEVQLPFLQRLLSSFDVLPIVVGHADPDDVAKVVEHLWGGSETLIVVSSDLSHYEPHAAATVHDRRTVGAILEGDIDAIDGYDACGAAPLRGLLVAAERARLQPRLLDLRTSGDTAGSRDRVVGYGAFAFTAVP